MSDNSLKYRPIPGWEHYGISRDGEIMTGFGFPLKTKKGKATLCHKGVTRTVIVADLVAELWPLIDIVLPEETAEAPVADRPKHPDAYLTGVLADSPARETLPETPNTILRQQKTIDALKAENEALRKKSIKLERQRDNLAAGRLLAIAVGGDAYGDE